MKVSIRKKMFIISLATTIMSFVLIMISFNLICNSYIKKDSVLELQSAVKSAESIGIKTSMNLLGSQPMDSVEAMPLTEAAIIKNSVEAVDTLQQELINNGNSISVMIAANAENIYPMETIGTLSGALPIEKAEELKNYAELNPSSDPEKITLDDGNYYIMSMPVNDTATMLFYKDIQPLEDLVANVNTALLILLLVCGVVTIAVSMGMSNGMVKSIRQLCGFAEDIGSGDFRERDFKMNELELEILASDMNIMARQLSDSNVEQKTFFQNVSHELRTPLMSIQGYAEGITTGIFKEEKTKDAADIILAESNRLTSMVEDILYFSRMDAIQDKDKSEKIDCLDAVRSVIQQSEVLFLDKYIELKIIESTTDFIAYGNRKDFEKALLNILSNGLRYAKNKVQVTCDILQGKIIIEDDGNGIKEEDLPFIFKRFYKGEGGCTGIGLAISHGVIEKMGGSIEAENKKSDELIETGAVFTITLNKK